MEHQNAKFQDGLAELEKYISGAVAKMAEHKTAIRKLNSEINELKRLHALSEKKADRLKRELDEARSNNEKSWRGRESDIKRRLVQLSAKLSAFEKSYTNGS
jgi:chromosome segregation ATPase